MKTVIEECMPGWNGSESIIAYVIRIRKQREERAAAKRRARIQMALLVANLIIWPMAGLVAVVLVEKAMGL